MEQMFQQNFFAFFLELKQFRFYFTKAITSFMKMSLEVFLLLVLFLKSLGYLLFVGPSLYKVHSPTERSQIERKVHAQNPWQF